MWDAVFAALSPRPTAGRYAFNNMDIFYIRLYAILLIVGSVLWFIHQNRETLVSKVLLFAYGPKPVDKEPKYVFLFGWAKYSFVWLILSTILWGIFYLFSYEYVVEGSIDSNPFIIAILFMILPLSIFTSLTAALWFSVKAMFFRLFKSEIRYSISLKEYV